MSVIWDKLWFDLWQRKVRTALAVLSIAAGVFAIGAIFGMVDQMLSAMDAAHRAVMPSHMNIVLRQTIDADTARNLATIPGVAGVEALNQTTVRYKKAGNDEWETGTITMRDDFNHQQYDWLQLRQGSWPEDQQVAVERISSDYYDIHIGDEIIFELEGTDRVMPVTGIIRHPFVAPPDFGGNANFFVDGEGMARFGIPEGRFFQLLVQVEPYSEAYARDRAAAIKDQLAKQGVGVSIIIYQKPDQHWGREQVLGITLVLQILAVVALLASVIIVINTTTAVITQQTDQIGVIRAIGGKMWAIIKIYLAAVLVYGLLALLIALPLGIMASFGATRWLLSLFNIDYDTVQLSARTLTLQMIAALAAPLLAALWPVLKAATMSVREAISSYGIGADFGSNKVDRWVESLGERLLPGPFAVAIGNVFRRKGRLVLTQLVLVLAGTMFLMVMTLAASMTTTLEAELARRAYDLRLNFLGNERTGQVKALVETLPGVIYAEPWYSVSGTVLQEGQRIQDTGGLGAEVYGIPAGSNMYRPLITSGRWLGPEETGRVAIINRDTAEFNGLVVGDQITIDLGELGEADWEVIGVFQALTPDLITTDPIYVPADALFAATKRSNRANQVRVVTQPKDAASTMLLLEELTDLLEERNIDVNAFFSRTKWQDRDAAFATFGVVNNMLFGLALVMGVVGGISLMGSLSISVVERRREIGVLRSIGARSQIIAGLFVSEGVIQGLMSWLVAVPLAFLVARPVANLLGQTIFETNLDFAFSYIAVVIWLVLILTIAVLASVIPALNATRVSVRQSLSYA